MLKCEPVTAAIGRRRARQPPRPHCPKRINANYRPRLAPRPAIAVAPFACGQGNPSGDIIVTRLTLLFVLSFSGRYQLPPAENQLPP